ncbi:DegT/DnrJ/EryC1/StrS aminotransferase family protein [Roseivirga sp. E12]|uniref:DegT/DnrJ/EryC1/StrS family aminotransferase n=1 Tax=Roseivirga sp. E12 TaxID=2819237 RepID=UPI001ABC9F15|nr:DegT/DnrJ/EryC1/StrS family aminotransferase [Roseivirga sp. E12]MBO3698356.1 DegT/DnrJ/EryC1/StrS family aminotransferase [Roseivirga sp. E12]
MTDRSKILLSSPHLGGHEQKFVQTAFDTNWIAPLGPNVDGFESDLQDYSGVPHAAVLASGTAAIHLALIILGVKQYDEVLVSTFTFSGSVNPIIYQGGVPIMVDSEPETWNMSPEHLENAIVDRLTKTGNVPKALILVHLYGMPAKLDEIIEVCKKYEIPIIEDAAEALGSSYKNRKLGSFGDMSIYSFNGNKIITTSGGGALLSNNEEWIKRSRFLATQARDNYVHYEHSAIGYNYRMSNVVAGIGRGQMLVLDDWVEKRRTINSFYRQLLEGLDGVEFLVEPNNDYFSNHWLSALVIDESSLGLDRERIRLHLLADNIESRPLWKPMHMQPIFSHFPYYGDRLSERLFHNGLCLPSGSNLGDPEMHRIEKSLNRLLLKG